MINKHNIKKVLLLGSGALQIGQAGEFDYSGSQAIKALKEEGIKVILINPNIATIQTSKGFADKVYFLPITPYFVEEIIKAEKPDGILLSFGGQTALNCGLELSSSGVLKKYKVKVLGSPVKAIEITEDRHVFAKTLQDLNLLIPQSVAIKTVKDALSAATKIGYPIMERSAFSLGGQDSQMCTSEPELEEAVTRALSKSPQVLIEEYLKGWKEIEYEVVRDKFDNCITVCNMENIDPMGIHTGESIVVAPSQTLNNFEYHKLREIAIKVIRHLGIVGECNIQFALNPKPKLPTREVREASTSRVGRVDYRIIEVNARLSRSSALASKATGYPLAYVAAKLGLGYSLTELKNSVTKKTIACFEPALDYLVVKFPRWDLGKFSKSNSQIGTSMQSVGEVMAIGRKFEEALQKASRMLDIGLSGVCDENAPRAPYNKPTPYRMFAVAQSIKKGTSIEKIHKATGIDMFFLEKIKNITEFEKRLSNTPGVSLASSTHTPGVNVLLMAKQLGFSDKRIARLTNQSESEIRDLRHRLHIRPSVKQIDTLAAEYPAETNYLYLTYNGDCDDISSLFTVNSSQTEFKNKTVNREPSTVNKIIVLGSGPYRIGSSVEFDWCCVTCAQTAFKNNFSPIIINCNPETVSTDFDMAERLYFEELTEETVLEICHKENPMGVIVSMGGQTPNNLVLGLAENGIEILGTSPNSIDKAEDRHKFSSLCDKLGIAQPAWAALTTASIALKFAEKIGFPVLVRPSYVLSGAAMNVAFDKEDLKKYLTLASKISNQYPVVISKFIENAKEIEIDAVAQNGEILAFAISEHVENAGVHSGDATLVLPPQKVNQETQKKIEQIARKIAKNLTITGPFNIQFLAKENKVSVIECNLRASRSLPFVSKVTGVNFVELATKAILAKVQKNYQQLPTTNFAKQNISYPLPTTYVGVKAPQFSFSRIKGADPILRVEMTSTGEVACFGQDIHEAFLKSLIATGLKLPKNSVFISLAGDENKAKFLESTKVLEQIGLKIFATAGTCAFLEQNGIKATMLYKIHEHKAPNVLNHLLSKKIDLVINIVDPYFKSEIDDDYLIRRASIDFNVPLLTNMQTAELFVTAIASKTLNDLKALPWSFYVKN